MLPVKTLAMQMWTLCAWGPRRMIRTGDVGLAAHSGQVKTCSIVAAGAALTAARCLDLFWGPGQNQADAECQAAVGGAPR
jgi:hypothetical protein